MKARVLLLICMLATVGSVCAQRGSISVYGRVVDRYTRSCLPDITVTLMREDSTVVAQAVSSDVEGRDGSVNYVVVAPGKGKYILRFSSLYYHTEYLNTEVKAVRSFNQYNREVKMTYKRRQLKALEVNATKIKMVVKNDTLVFNADAFQLAQGSMLDRLIAMLPGVELDGSRIKVNGRFVSNLLVNGEDFFHGDPQVALDNLPAYMVDKVKVYEKEPEDAYLRKPDPGKELPLVMDVNLKKEYSVGWIANAEAGYGTDNRYLGRIFGLRFTNHSRLSLFGNMNNLNDTRQPGSSGNWNPAWTADGRTKLKTAGAELLINDKDRRYKLISNVKVDYQDADMHSETSTVRFFEGGDVYRRARSLRQELPLHVYTTHKIEMKRLRTYTSITPTIHYHKYTRRSQAYSAEFSENPVERYRGAAIDSLFGRYGNNAAVQDILVNRTANLMKGDGHKWSGSVVGQMTMTPPRDGDWMNLYLVTSFDRYRFKQFNHNDLRYGKAAEEGRDEFRNQHRDSKSESYYVNLQATYRMKFTRDWGVEFLYSGQYCYSSSDESLFRLDRYEAWNAADKHPLGSLPSTRDSLLNALDVQNSTYYTNPYHIHRPEIHFYLPSILKIGTPGIYLPVRIQHDELRYRQHTLDTTIRRTFAVFEPTVYYQWTNNRRFNLRTEYKHTVTQPSMLLQLDVRNDANPLVVRLGNPHLDRGHTHKVSLRVNGVLQKHQRSYGVGGEYVRQTNSVAQGVTYDRTTGISTYRPENVDGNWQASGYVDYSQAVDKKQRVQLSTNTSVNYLNSVDLSRISGNDRSTRSEVGNFNLSETLRADYRYNGYSFGVKARASWRHSASDRRDFTTINSVDFNYGLTALVPLPWKLELSTDLTMFSRRGYNDRSMNTDDLVWNARLSRTFLKGNLICMVDGFDILGRLSNITQSINEQGRTETWRNVVHRYAMLHVAYRLNRQPKKKTY